MDPGHGFALLLLAMSLGPPHGAQTLAQGGPSAFGYDASSACGKPYSRMGRARLQSLPCDFQRENWCTVAGNAYPWQAVRRFVQENQGLMKRMYGTEKHISVLKTELENNDVDLELENDHNKLYTDADSSLFRQLHYQVDEEFEDGQSSGAEERSANRDYSARSMSIGASSSKQGQLKSSEPLAPEYRWHPNETPITVSSASSSAWSTDYPSTTGKTIFSHTQRVRNGPSVPPSQTREREGEAGTASKTPGVSLAQIAKIRNSSINEIPGQVDRLDADVDALTDALTDVPEPLTEATLESQIDGLDPDVSTVRGIKADESPPIQDTASPEGTGTTNGQLFQANSSKDTQDPPVLTVRGINACAVKEEVVAPFWANNTRGELLALLNLYPFEQYVHWEKCTHENKQMYCREGCRCEQQYRLHRLLAYDPNNECRGIFSDWFKFPSCCICRCYDLPVEFRVTSRSPRDLHRQRIKVRPPGSPTRQVRPVSPRRV